MSTIDHEHVWTQRDRNENEDRIRTSDRCPCGAVRYGCFPKRTGTGEGDFNPATFAFPPGHEPKPNDGVWGPVDGQWHYSITEAAR